MSKYAETVRPKAYRGSDARKLATYKRQSEIGKQIGVFLDEVQAKVDREARPARIIAFSEISETLHIPIEDVKSCLWNKSGGGDTGITILGIQSR